MKTRPFSLLIKPASADCNLRCAYCFYLPKRELYPQEGPHRMEPEVLERLVSGYLATEQETHAFGWQGGEPSLLGAGFFREVTTLERRYGRPGTSVANGLQTNATLVDEPLARHLARYSFLVGVSLDGPAGLHDTYRRSASGSPSHARVLEGVALLRRYGVEHNALVVVSAANAGHGQEVYRYLTGQGFQHHQYIPCVEAGEDGRMEPYTVDPEDWGAFLCEVFDAWRADDVGRVSVRLFDSVLLRLLEGRADVCTMGRSCRQYFLVEHNGDVYPCDFYAERDLLLGNIMSSDWEVLLASPRYASFGARKSRVSPACRSCPYWGLCAGDCPRHRLPEDGNPRKLSWLCPGWKMFYAHALPELTAIAARLGAARPRPPRERTTQPAS